MSDNPYKIQANASISFSGGRSSAYMLYHIIDAWDGKLPSGLTICFANTGKEEEATLAFVKQCGEEWGVHINWLEYRDEKPRFVIVDYETASRNGEPFDAIITRKQFLPNPVTRFCTTWLKIEVMQRFMKSLGYKSYNQIIGLRADEQHRIKPSKTNTLVKGEKLYPMVSASVTKHDVDAFWAKQSFDLQLERDFGNCNLCFLKGKEKKKKIIKANPQVANWWIAQEQKLKNRTRSNKSCQFRKEYSYEQLVSEVNNCPNPFELCNALPVAVPACDNCALCEETALKLYQIGNNSLRIPLEDEEECTVCID